MEEDTKDMDDQVASLALEVRAVVHGLGELTAELRRTNDTVQTLHADQRVMNERVTRLNAEVFTPDSASRIRSCELHVRGLYALFGFLTLTVGGFLVGAFLHSLGLPMPGWGK